MEFSGESNATNPPPPLTPAHAGVQGDLVQHLRLWIPASAGMSAN